MSPQGDCDREAARLVIDIRVGRSRRRATVVPDKWSPAAPLATSQNPAYKPTSDRFFGSRTRPQLLPFSLLTSKRQLQPLALRFILARNFERLDSVAIESKFGEPFAASLFVLSQNPNKNELANPKILRFWLGRIGKLGAGFPGVAAVNLMQALEQGLSGAEFSVKLKRSCSFLVCIPQGFKPLAGG